MTEYFTENDDILDNKLGIDDPALMQQAEEEIVTPLIVDLEIEPIQGRFNFEHLKAIHRYLFGDIYDIAGEVRTVDMAKNGSVFCYVQNIDMIQSSIFDKLRNDNYLRGMQKSAFVRALAQLSGDLNALHPFREGNGRAIRCFLKQLAREVGYDLDYDGIAKEELLQADIEAFRGSMDSLAELYADNCTALD